MYLALARADNWSSGSGHTEREDVPRAHDVLDPTESPPRILREKVESGNYRCFVVELCGVDCCVSGQNK